MTTMWCRPLCRAVVRHPPDSVLFHSTDCVSCRVHASCRRLCVCVVAGDFFNDMKSKMLVPAHGWSMEM
jgi:hypothetical protein